MMRTRCNYERHIAYKHYGGRGIKVCPEWDDPDTGFETWLKFIGPAPSTDYTQDRVDNDLGYSPYQADGTTRQVRWATSAEQRSNQRPRKYSEVNK